MEICRGDIYFVRNFVKVSGSEQTAERPAVIVSNDTGNKFSSMCEVVYLTTKDKKPLPTHVEVMARIPSTAMCEQITSVSQDRLTEYIRTCTDEEMAAIDRALMVSLGLDLPVATELPAVNRISQIEIDDLRMKLEGAERELDERNTEIQDLINKLKTVKAESQLTNFDATRDVMKAEVERDFYKQQYERLFAVLLERAG